MPQVDAKLLFSDDQAETTVPAHDSTNTVDLGAATPNSGAATPKWLNIICTEAVTSGGAGTVAFSLQDSTDHSTWVIIWQTDAIAKATLVKGYTLAIPLPAEHSRYLKVVYTIGTAVLTAGKFSAWISLTPVRTVT